MLLFRRVAVFLVFFAGTVSSDESTTCAMMNVAVLQKIAEGLCTTSCTGQKCATGVCKKVESRPTCFCNGCSPGSIEESSLDSLISKLPR